MKLFIASGLLAMGFAVSKLTGSHASTRRVKANDNVISDPSSPLSTKKEYGSISSHESDNVQDSISSQSNVDVGVLSKNFKEEVTTLSIPSISRGLSSHETACANGTVVCENGMFNATQTCYAACDDGASCCGGYDACTAFTGVVCKDGSCSGDSACANATIGLVTQESCVGTEACAYAGYDEGTIGVISDSCKNGTQTCMELAQYGGNVSRVVNSCKDGDEACEYVATISQYDYIYFESGTIEAIVDSCFGYRSCRYMAYDGGTIGLITESCVGYQSCASAAEYGGMIEKGINASCNGTSSCYGAAYNGTVLGIDDACNAFKACEDIGNNGGNISQVVGGCCNDDYQCNTTSSVSDQCFAMSPPTSSPTSSPTSAPTQRPTDKPSSKPTPQLTYPASGEPSKAGKGGKQGKEDKEAKAGKQAKTFDEKVDVNNKRTRHHTSGGQDRRPANLRAASDKQHN